MSTTVYPGDLITLDPNDKPLITFDWDDKLAVGATISTNTFTITAIKQNGVTALTKDNETTGSRSATLRLLATTATAGDKYEVASKVVTNESPAQQFERSIKVKIENR